MERMLIFKMTSGPELGLERKVRFVATRNIQATNIGEEMTYQEALKFAKHFQAEFMFCDSSFQSCE